VLLKIPPAPSLNGPAVLNLLAPFMPHPLSEIDFAVIGWASLLEDVNG